MRRINSSNVVADLFGPGKDGFGKGNPATGQLATYVSPEWCNHIQEEIARVVEATGGTLDPTKYDQLRAAIATMISAAISSIGRAGYDIPWLAGYASDLTGQDLAVQSYGRVVLARPVKLAGLVATLGVAATGAPLIIDIRRNGTSIWSTLPRFAAGAVALTAGVLDAAQVTCAAGDTLTLHITQVGSTIRGQQLTVSLKGTEA